MPFLRNSLTMRRTTNTIHQRRADAFLANRFTKYRFNAATVTLAQKLKQLVCVRLDAVTYLDKIELYRRRVQPDKCRVLSNFYLIQSVDDNHLCLWRIVAMLQAGTAWRARIAVSPPRRCRHNRLQFFQRDRSFPKQERRVAGAIDNRGFEADLRSICLENAINAAI